MDLKYKTCRRDAYKGENDDILPVASANIDSNFACEPCGS